MKRIILFTCLPLWLLAQNPSMVSDSETITKSTIVALEGDDWLKNYDEALKDAKKEKRNVLVYFTGSDWCSPCKMLKKDLFDTTAFKEISAEYTLLYIDIPRNRELISSEQMEHNSELLHKINKKGVFPLFVILNHKGKQLDQYSGYNMSGEVKYHMDLLEKYRR